MNALRDRFLELMGRYSKDSSYDLYCWDEIEKSYSVRSRHYHNLGHLAHMLEELDEARPLLKVRDGLLFALYYHDIIYRATRSDNEHQSALLFEKRISRTSFPFVKESMKQIELTKTHEKTDDFDANMLVDLDLSILGQDRDRYEDYCRDIRKEYRIYPDFMYRKGRKKALEHLLGLDSLFKTDYFIEKYEMKARENLSSERDSLR